MLNWVINRIILLMIGFVFLTSLKVSAQNAEPILTIDTCWSHELESVYLHLPQQTLVGGDKLFFRAYLLNTYPQKVSNLSSILYFDIVAPNGQIITKWKSYVENNTCFGEIYIPDTLASGIYKLRTYTAWMLNTGNDYIFEAAVLILNSRSRDLEKLSGLQKSFEQNETADSLARKDEIVITPSIKSNELSVSIDANIPICDYKLLAVLNGRVIGARELIDYSGELLIRMNNSSSGIVYLIIINSANKVIAQSSLPFSNYQKDAITIEALKNEFKAGEPIELQLELNSAMKLDSASVSFSVTRMYNLSFIPKLPAMNKYFGVYSKVPNNYLIQSNLSDSGSYNLKNLTWLTSPWAYPLQKSQLNFKYTKESELALLCGKLSHKLNGTNVSNEILSMSIKDTIPYVKFTNLTNDGEFYFWLDKAFNDKELYLSIKNDTFNFKNISWNIYNTDAPVNNYQRKAINITKSDEETINEISQLFLVSSFYRPDKTNKIADTVSYDPFILYPPNFIVFPNEYNGLNNFMDIVNNIIPLATLKQNGDYLQLVVRNPETKEKYNSPLVLLNGIPFSDLDVLAALPASEIVKVEVYNSVIYYGDYTLRAIVSVQTLAGSASENKAILNAKAVQNKVLKLSNKVYSFTGTAKRDKPNFNSLIYWNPEIKLNSGVKTNISFVASELAGTYKIQIEGLSANGEPISLSRSFTVK